MKLKVDIYILNRDAEDVKAGEIIFDGEKITASNDSDLMRAIASIPIELDWSGKYIDPEKEPERFVRNLWRRYFHPYLRAMKATSLIFALAVLAAATADAGVDRADLALAAAQLEQATETEEPGDWAFVPNADMDEDAVELAPEEEAYASQFFQFKPSQRPAAGPKDIAVRVFQFLYDGDDVIGIRFLGWLWMQPEHVQALHAEVST